MNVHSTHGTATTKSCGILARQEKQSHKQTCTAAKSDYKNKKRKRERKQNKNKNKKSVTTKSPEKVRTYKYHTPGQPIDCTV